VFIYIIITAISDFWYFFQHPPLRFGAFSASLEEWAEGALLLEWVRSKRIVSQEELGLVDSTEYIGALSDFTGEIGRCGVAAASKRDVNEVYSILQTMISVSIALTQLDCGGRFLKKTDAVQMNLKKMQDVHYELVLLSRGGKPGKISKDPGPSDSGSNDNDL
jgi:predicted translin family RNA/ssDNA-binding protein